MRSGVWRENCDLQERLAAWCSSGDPDSHLPRHILTTGIRVPARRKQDPEWICRGRRDAPSSFAAWSAAMLLFLLSLSGGSYYVRSG